MNICVIDDEKSVLNIITKTLTRKGFNVYSFLDSKDAVDFLLKKGSEIDVVISDFNVEPLNGFEINKIVNNSLKSSTKFIIMSGLEPDNIPENVIFIQKPFMQEELFNKIN